MDPSPGVCENPCTLASPGCNRLGFFAYLGVSDTIILTVNKQRVRQRVWAVCFVSMLLLLPVEKLPSSNVLLHAAKLYGCKKLSWLQSNLVAHWLQFWLLWIINCSFWKASWKQETSTMLDIFLESLGIACCLLVGKYSLLMNLSFFPVPVFPKLLWLICIL